MTDPPPEPQQPDLSEKITDGILKAIAGGGGLSSLYFLFFSEDILRAVMAMFIAFGAGLAKHFWQGFGGVLNPGAKKVGEGVGKAVTETVANTASRFTDFPAQYQEAVKIYCTAVEVEGFQGLTKLPLQDVFIPPLIDSAAKRHLAQTPKSIWHFLSRKMGEFPHRRLAIVAQPGYGKTTLLRHLAYRYVTNPPHNTPPFLPILLRFREIYSLIPAAETAEPAPDLIDLIQRHLANQPHFQKLKPTRQWLESQFERGAFLVLLDGLDEVPKSRRDAVRQWTDRQMKAYRHTQFILTSRPHGLQQKADDPSHPIERDRDLEVLDFTNNQKQDFIEKWYRTYLWVEEWEPQWRNSQDRPVPERLSKEDVRLQSDSQAAERAQSLTEQLFKLPALADLARNPLLLTMIAATHNANVALPKDRVEIYGEICKLLLGTRPFVKKTRLTLPASGNQRVLQVLAWKLMEAEIAQFSAATAEKWIAKTLSRCDKDKSLIPAAFFAEMLEIAGLLLEKESGRYEFAHQTFQEYFAALYLKERGEAGRKTLLAQLDNDRWQEVICFYAALGNADPLIEALLEEPTAKHLELANRCKNEGREVSPEMVERLDRALQAANLDSSPEVRLEQRFRQLTPLGDKTAISEPITWGEYQLFLADQASEQFHSSAEVREISSEQYNRPVARISPQDARWFCAWLSTQANLQEQGAVCHYRLPNEEEMQQAGEPSGIIASAARPGAVLRVVREAIPNRYQALLNYLANGRWREADGETEKVMLAVAGQQERGFLMPEDIDNFPCEDLRIIDRLWLKFSGGRFGFSVQKEIYERLGGTREYNHEVWEKFCEEVGWRRDGEYMSYSELTWNLKDAPPSHLPWGCRTVTPRGHLLSPHLLSPRRCCVLSRKDL